MRRGIPAIVALLAVATACSHDGRVLVVVESDLAVPGTLATVRATVRSDVGEQVRDFPVVGYEGAPGDRAQLLPLSFLVVPRDAGERRDFEVVVEGHSGTDPSPATLVVSRRAVTGFIAGRTLVLPMPLLSSCVGVTCPDGQTCTVDGCRDATVDPATLQTTDTPGGELRLDAGRPDAGPGCARWGPFGTPSVVAELSSPDDECCSSLAADELSLVFSSNRGGVYWLYEAVRARATDAFAEVRPLEEPAEVPTTANEPALSDDGLVLYYQVGINAGPIYWSKRARRSDPFEPRGPIAGPLGVGSNWFGVGVGERFMVVTNPSRDLSLSELVDGAFGPPVLLAPLQTAGEEGFGELRPDALTIVYHSGAGGGADPFQVQMATRSSVDLPFDPPARIVELGVAADVDITADGDTIWFTSDVGGDPEIYSATRECLDPAP